MLDAIQVRKFFVRLFEKGVGSARASDALKFMDHHPNGAIYSSGRFWQ